jgi:hypothetical protein
MCVKGQKVDDSRRDDLLWPSAGYARLLTDQDRPAKRRRARCSMVPTDQ